MAAGHLIQANAWGGAWGASWWAAWGNAWGGWTVSVDEVHVYIGGGGRRLPITTRHVDALTDDLVRQQWELLEQRLRNRRADTQPAPDESGRQEPEIAPEAGAIADTPANVVLTMPQVAAKPDATPEIAALPTEEHMAAQARRRRNQEALLLIMSQV